MAFTETERQQLMELKFVGAKIIERLEEMNFDSFGKLRNASLDEILNKGALLTGSTCWKNSHQAKTAISNILSLVNNT
ncbi:helix-hairpin-helix domain-containing protein [Gilliamella sp. ESL0250]|uniref:helix-hairpin-helix domain-containing protein n=1 Tax=Gilliamella sp. ESL0250 TaxID=2705036 RepID=UPI001580C707|nr:helix-hairpin-helix domain-containing protein [Gilliamella sp. ESL0250]NUF49307.1 helix-hairpin-helix domain-containing protein [Gilliamella sp. ESL0250]